MDTLSFNQLKEELDILKYMIRDIQHPLVHEAIIDLYKAYYGNPPEIGHARQDFIKFCKNRLKM